METPREPKITEAQDEPSRRQATTITPIKRMPPRVCGALVLLLESLDYASDLGESPWQFAVEQHSLRDLGLTNSDFRWLVGKQLVDHARETTVPGDRQRSFRQSDHLVLSNKTCFVLSEQGLALAHETAIGEKPLTAPTAAVPLSRKHLRFDSSNGTHHPTWDRDRLELRVGDQIVKQFKVPAANQETILAAFEEENWPPRIDDPLPPQPDQDPKRRLHDTINSLNRNQKCSLLRFFGDGSGKGIRWELVPNSRQCRDC
ncbi:MAG TPA: hypothetical protein VGG64_00725 [Pirellulales bacterium]|jgi:hypothetical protein